MAKIVGFGYRFGKKRDTIFALWDDGKRTIWERKSYHPAATPTDELARQYAKARDVAFAGEILPDKKPSVS